MTSVLRIDVHDLLRAPGTSRRVELAAPMDDLDLSGGHLEGPVTVAGRLDGLVEGIWFDGFVSGDYGLECVRCLTPVTVPFDLEAAELFSSDVAAGSDEGYPLAGEQIDFEPLVRDVVILGLPARPLCSDDCLGLCAQCGTNRNEGQCDCRVETGHPAFQQLRDVFSERK
jgi:uncharacterized protein